MSRLFLFVIAATILATVQAIAGTVYTCAGNCISKSGASIHMSAQGPSRRHAFIALKKECKEKSEGVLEIGTWNTGCATGLNKSKSGSVVVENEAQDNKVVPPQGIANSDDRSGTGNGGIVLPKRPGGILK